MPLIEAALAFAITMLALSLIVSSFVEVIHRAFKMREEGLQYMLEQLFDQVLVKYAAPLVDEKTNDSEFKIRFGKLQKEYPALKDTEVASREVRDGFVERMTTNRSPVGLKPDPTLAGAPGPAKPRWWPEALWWLENKTKPPWWPAVLWRPERAKPWWWPSAFWPENTKPGLRLGNMWGGRRVTQLTPTDFMERLGSIGVGNKIRETATNTEKNAADVTDNALKGVAQKIAAIDVSAEIAAAAAATGQSAKDTANAALNAAIAQKLAGINVSEEIKKVATTTGQIAADTLDTVLKDIAQKFDGFGKDAASYFEGRARFMSVMVAIVLAFAVHVDAVDLFKTYLRDPNARAKVIEQSQAVTAQYKAAQDAADAAKKLVPDPNAAPADVKAAVEKLQKDWAAAIANTNTTVKQYADLGVPLGWTDVRIADAKMWHWLWTCKNLNAGDTERLWTLRQECRTDDAQGYTAPRDQEGRPLAGLQHKNIWMEVPTAPGVWLYLILGGLLIGLGSPFWFDAVTSLTSLRSAVSGSPGSASQPAAGAAADAGKGQPVTPVGAFRVSNAALNAQPK